MNLEPPGHAIHGRSPGYADRNEGYESTDTTMSRARPRSDRPRARLFATSCLLALVACGGDTGTDPVPPAGIPDDEGEGVVGAWVRSGGRVRSYQLFAPIDLAAPAPLLIVLHGSGGTGEELRFITGFDDVAGPRGVLVAYPDGVTRSWAVGCNCTDADALGVDDVQFLHTLVDQIDAALPVDRNRVFIAGFSQGSMMAQRAVCDAADSFAGLGAVGAGLPRALQGVCRPTRPVPTVLIHGEQDRVVPWTGNGTLVGSTASASFWATANGCLAEPTRIDLPDAVVDGTSVWEDTWPGCPSNAPTVLYGVRGGGHTWPGSNVQFAPSLGLTTQDLSASERILAFFTKEES